MHARASPVALGKLSPWEGSRGWSQSTVCTKDSPGHTLGIKGTRA